MSAETKTEKPLVLKLPAVAVDPNNVWAGDKLERKLLAPHLKQIIESANQSFTLGIDGEYGSGKTFLLTRLQYDLPNTTVVYLDAWSSDFSGDPMAAFISALDQQLTRVGAKSEIKKRVKDLARAAAPLMIKAVARKALGEEGVKEWLDEIGTDGDQISETLKGLATKRIRAQRETEKSVEGFKTSLAEIASELRKNSRGPGLVVFVDELDRCRPSYAIELLEHIKHFFSVEGVVFVVATDRAQLKSTVKARYGSEFDADGYLRKFFDWWIRLPSPDFRRYANYLVERFNLVADGVLVSMDYFDNGAKVLSATFASIAEKCDLTLREQEQIFVDINAALRSSNRKIPCFAVFLPIFAIGHHVLPDECRRFCTHKYPDKAFLDWAEKSCQDVDFPYEEEPLVSLAATYIDLNEAEKARKKRSLGMTPELFEGAIKHRSQLLTGSRMPHFFNHSLASLIYSEIVFWSNLTS
ncbi:MAG: P-loop NTPase fold protein [Hyphomicrobium sp.]|uniref:KAP family P-loop NTPase fold protein n=1 Tax=Hyphomicrobium sp. TaxID=82 RepID=UPI0039E2645C